MSETLERVAIELRYAAHDCGDTGMRAVLNEMARLLELLALK